MTLTQNDRVLRALERAGRHGITAVDFQLPDVVDGGKPILRLAARIEELSEQGHRIVDGGRRGRVKIYKLATASEGSAASAAEASSSWDGGRGLPSGAERLTDWWACMSCGTRTQGADPVMDCCDSPTAITFAATPAQQAAEPAGCDCQRCDQGYPCAHARAAA